MADLDLSKISRGDLEELYRRSLLFQDKSCEWRPDGDDAWNTGCKMMFNFSDGGIADNGFEFCPFCAFGRRQVGLQLGVPSGSNGHRLFNVDWALALPIMEAHIAKQRALISALSEKARAELDAP